MTKGKRRARYLTFRLAGDPQPRASGEGKGGKGEKEAMSNAGTGKRTRKKGEKGMSQ